MFTKTLDKEVRWEEGHVVKSERCKVVSVPNYCMKLKPDYEKKYRRFFTGMKLEVQVRFPVLPDFLRSTESETGFTQTFENN
jgi:hypothetical protein